MRAIAAITVGSHRRHVGELETTAGRESTQKAAKDTKINHELGFRDGNLLRLCASPNARIWSFHNLRDIYLFTMKVMFYILWYAPGWEDVTTQYIGGDALSCYRSAPSGERCRGDREAAGFTLGQCITLAHKMAAGWTEGS